MNNPLIQREFFGILRNPRAIAALVCLAFAFSAMVLMRWPSDAVVDLSFTQSQLVFQIFGYGLMLGLILLVPAFPASSIVKERNKGTLALLLNSPLSSWNIYLGKFAGVLLFTLLLLLTSLPAAAACYAMGGIDLVGGLGTLYGVLLLLAVQYVTLGLLVSTYVQSADAGVRVTYALVFMLSFAVLGPHYLLQGKAGTLPIVAEWLRQLSPLPVVMRLLGHGDVGGQGLIASESSVRFFLLGGLVSLGFCIWAIARLNHRLFDRARSKGHITQERSLIVQIARRLFFLVDPQRRKSGIPWYLNPVMVKEFRCRRFGRLHWLLRLIAICAVISLLLTLAAVTGTMDWKVESIGGLLVLLQVGLVVMITPSLAANLVSSERESGGWDLLRLTPLSSWKILRGKLLSVFWTMLLVLTATVPGYWMMIQIKPVLWLQVNYVLICLAATAIVTLAVSAVVGTCFRKTATATTTAYISLMVLFLGPIIIWLGRDSRFGHDTVETALMANPMGAALSEIEMEGFAGYELLPGSWWVAGIASALLFLVLLGQTWYYSRPT